MTTVPDRVDQTDSVASRSTTEIVNVQAAETHLSRLPQRVEAGGTILLARGGRTIARLEPLTARSERELGFIEARLPDSSFFAPLPDDELDARES